MFGQYSCSWDMSPPNTPWGKYQLTMTINPSSPHPSPSWHSWTPCGHCSRTQDHHRDKSVNKSHNSSHGPNHTTVAMASSGSYCHGTDMPLPIHWLSLPLHILPLWGKPGQLTYLVKVQPGRETTFFSVLNLTVAAQGSSFTQQGSLAPILPLPETQGRWMSSGRENTAHRYRAAEFAPRTCRLQAWVQLSRSHPKTICQASGTQLFCF